RGLPHSPRADPPSRLSYNPIAGPSPGPFAHRAASRPCLVRASHPGRRLPIPRRTFPLRRSALPARPRRVPSPALRPLWALVAAAIALVAPATARAADDYPKLGLYGHVTGTGWPLADSTGALRPAVLDEVARYHQVVLDASPLTEYRSDALVALRQRRPGIRLLAYVLGEEIWNANSADSAHHFPTRYRHLVRNLGGFLYDKHGNEFPTSNINLAKKDGQGRYAVALGIADLFHDAILATGLWDGIFIDVYCNSILWSQTP